MENDCFQLPSLDLLKASPARVSANEEKDEPQQTAIELQATLDRFEVDVSIEGWIAGPTVTLFKISLGEGVRLAEINSLADDIALALAAPAVRIFSPIPGTTLVGIEVPNINRSTVLLGDVLPAAPEGVLQLAIGKDVEGDSIVANLEKMPHLLIGGTTGSGKSVAINTMIMSILMRATPAQVRMILIDPKMVELSLYNDIPHLYVPVVTDAQKAAAALAWGVLEMERRLKVFQQAGAKNIAQHNDYVRKEIDEMPSIVIVIDELADLMMAAGEKVEHSISRLAQCGRIAGIHLIITTQRPSTNVITGLIKANIINRIAFNVVSGIDSRVILDVPGAEKLIGSGDMLFSCLEYEKPRRIQGCYVTESEIKAVVGFLKNQDAPDYHEDIFDTEINYASSDLNNGSSHNECNPLFLDSKRAFDSFVVGDYKKKPLADAPFQQSSQAVEFWNQTVAHIIRLRGDCHCQIGKLLSYLTPEAVADTEFILSADNAFVKDWIESHYRQEIEDAFFAVLGYRYALKIVCSEKEDSPLKGEGLEDRSLAILRLLMKKAETGPADMAKSLDISAPTAHRLLVGLKEKGFVETTPDRKSILSSAGLAFLASLPDIGEAFGGQDHTTVMYACNYIEKKRQMDSSVRSDIDRLIEALNNEEN